MSFRTLARHAGRTCALTLLLAACTDRTLEDGTASATDSSGGATDPGDPSDSHGGSLTVTTATSATTATTVSTTSPGTATTATVTTAEPPEPTSDFTASATGPVDTDTFGGTTVSDFILPVDVGGTFGCDLWKNDCPPGQKCASFDESGVAWDGSRCVDIAPNPGGIGDPCSVADQPFSGQDTCGPHMMCWDVDEQTLTGTCIAMCTGSELEPVCPAESSCQIANDGFVIPCVPDCDPLDPDTCGEELCVFLPGENGGPPRFFCAVDALEDAGDALEPCEFLNACEPTLTCVEVGLVPACAQEFFGCCVPFCDVTAPNTCPAPGLACVPLFEPGEAPGKETLGTCITPG